ncbi:MAG: hypothetical protein AABY65_13505 [Nitrospirota bacterium]
MRRGIPDLPPSPPSTRAERLAAFFLPIAFSLLFVNVNGASAEWVEWIADAEVGLVHEDNINRSAWASNEKKDTSLVPAVSLGRIYQLADATRLRVTADFEAAAYDKYDLLNYWKAGAALALRHKLGVGPDVPWVQARLAGAYMDARDEMRESKLYSAGLLAGKRFDERIDARIGYTYDVRDGKDGPVSSPSIPTDVFDQRAQTVSLDAGYILADRLLVTAGYAYRYGDTDSACDGENIATVLAGEDVKALATESAFREPFCVYRLTGRVHSISLSASYSVLKGHGSLNLGFQRSYGKSRSLDYESGVIRAGFVYSY